MATQIHFLLLKISRINSLFTFLSRQEIQTKEINAPILNPSKKYPVKITNQRRSKNVMSIIKIYQNYFISQIKTPSISRRGLIDLKQTCKIYMSIIS